MDGSVGHLQGVPNMPCFSYLSSCVHSEDWNLNQSGDCWSRFLVSRGRDSLERAAWMSSESGMVGQSVLSSHMSWPVRMEYR